jgi:hypothetical protein
LKKITVAYFQSFLPILFYTTYKIPTNYRNN